MEDVAMRVQVTIGSLRRINQLISKVLKETPCPSSLGGEVVDFEEQQQKQRKRKKNT